MEEESSVRGEQGSSKYTARRVFDWCENSSSHSKEDLADLCLKGIILAATLRINCGRWQVGEG